MHVKLINVAISCAKLVYISVIRSAVSVNNQKRTLNDVYCDHCKGISVMVGLQIDCVCTHRIVSSESQRVLKQERNQNKKYAELMHISNVTYFYSFYIP